MFRISSALRNEISRRDLPVDTLLLHRQQLPRDNKSGLTFQAAIATFV
jgi:hypothetical protein